MILTGNSFYFDSVNVSFKIKARMNCETMNCIYVLKCTGCHKIYIGETNNLRHRINLHKDHAARNRGLNSVAIFINVPSMKVLNFMLCLSSK